MRKASTRRGKRTGFTLIEMMLVVALIAILSALGIWRSRELVPRIEARRVAQDLRSSLELARTKAQQSNREVRFRITDYDTSATSSSSAYAGAWILELGNKRSGSDSWSTIDNTEYDISKGAPQQAKNISLSYTGGDISGPTTCTCTNAVVFSPLGRVLNPVGDFTSNGDIAFTLVNKVSRANGVVDDYKVRLYRGGMARVSSLKSKMYQDDAGGTDLNSSY